MKKTRLWIHPDARTPARFAHIPSRQLLQVDMSPCPCGAPFRDHDWVLTIADEITVLSCSRESEPADGSHVLVDTRTGVHTFYRDDTVLPDTNFRWLATEADQWHGAWSWEELIKLGPVALVGNFEIKEG